MLALSIRQPWAWLILNAGKDIENRSWRTRYRGRLLIHAGMRLSQEDYAGAKGFAMRAGDVEIVRRMPRLADLPRGGIVGSVDLVDCVDRSDSPWFVGEHGFVLRDPQSLPFVPCAGKLGFFEVHPQ